MSTELSTGSESATRPLAVDHHRIDELLADAKRHLREGDLAAARESFAAFRSGLEHHIAVEEEVLFPAFERHTGIRDGGPTAVMRVEHAEMRRLLDEIAGALEAAGAERTSPLASLTALLFAHNGKEERILYPMCDRALADDPATRAELARRL